MSLVAVVIKRSASRRALLASAFASRSLASTRRSASASAELVISAASSCAAWRYFLPRPSAAERTCLAFISADSIACFAARVASETAFSAIEMARASRL